MSVKCSCGFKESSAEGLQAEHRIKFLHRAVEHSSKAAGQGFFMPLPLLLAAAPAPSQMPDRVSKSGPWTGGQRPGCHSPTWTPEQRLTLMVPKAGVAEPGHALSFALLR